VQEEITRFEIVTDRVHVTTADRPPVIACRNMEMAKRWQNK
jgi:hypothetical protein